MIEKVNILIYQTGLIFFKCHIKKINICIGEQYNVNLVLIGAVQ